MAWVIFEYRRARDQAVKMKSLEGWYYNETYCELSLWIVKAARALCVVIFYTLFYNMVFLVLNADTWWDLNYLLKSDDQNNAMVWVNQVSTYPIIWCMDFIVLSQVTEWFVMRQLIKAQMHKNYDEVMYELQNPVKMPRIRRTGIPYKSCIVPHERGCRRFFFVLIILIFSVDLACMLSRPLFPNSLGIFDFIVYSQQALKLALGVYFCWSLMILTKKLHRYEYDLLKKELRAQLIVFSILFFAKLAGIAMTVREFNLVKSKECSNIAG